jgi:hypothetical protein
MGPYQLQLDFSVADTVLEKPSPLSATVHDLNAARTTRRQADLSGVYQSIYESVKHVRLNRVERYGPETPAKKR